MKRKEEEEEEEIKLMNRYMEKLLLCEYVYKMNFCRN